MSETIFGDFLKQVNANPEGPAVIDGDRVVTYRQLAIAADTVSQRLPCGAAFVGVVMDHGVEMIASILGVLKAGAAYVPAEPTFPVERIAFMFDESAVDAVITQRSHADVVAGRPLLFVEPGTLGDAGTGDTFAPSGATSLPETAPTGSTSPVPDIFVDHSTTDGLAYVLYTSGTTGTPKGVSVENGNVCSYIRAFQAEFRPDTGDRMLQHSVCSFDIFVEEVFGCLLSGSALVIAPREICDDAPALVEFIEEQGVTIVDGFPYLMDAINAQQRRPRTVRLYISGGDVLHASQVSNLVHEAAVYNTYGPSETTCCASYFRCDGTQPLENGTYPIGLPVKGMSMMVVDENLHPVAMGQEGELLISGPDVSRGYLGTHPEQANFVALDDDTRAYRSGDMGYRRTEDGAYVFTHRKDDQVMIQGRRVEAKEVENVLLNDPAIRSAVVLPGVDDGGFSFLTAYIVPYERDFSLEALRERLARKLASFMIPEFFVELEEIPLNSHSKPDANRLPRMLKAEAA